VKSALGSVFEARQVSAAPSQRSRDAVAELDGHVAAVHDGDEHEPRVAPFVDAQTAECEAAHDGPWHDYLDADPEPHLQVDAGAAQRACRQQDEGIVVARFGAFGLLGSDGQHRARAGAEYYARRHDLQPLRHRLAARRSPRRADDHLFGTVVPHPDRSRARHRQDEPCG
jgi:hypothetical protein